MRSVFKSGDYSQMSKAKVQSTAVVQQEPDKMSPEVIKEQKRLAEKYGIKTFDRSGNVTFDGTKSAPPPPQVVEPQRQQGPQPQRQQRVTLPSRDNSTSIQSQSQQDTSFIQKILPPVQPISSLVSSFRDKQSEFVGPREQSTPYAFAEIPLQRQQPVQQRHQEVWNNPNRFGKNPKNIDNVIKSLEGRLSGVEEEIFNESNRIRTLTGNANVNVENEQELLQLSSRYKSLYNDREQMSTSLNDAKAEKEKRQKSSKLFDFYPEEKEKSFDYSVNNVGYNNALESPFNGGIPTVESFSPYGNEISEIDSSLQRMESDSNGLTGSPIRMDPIEEQLQSLKNSGSTLGGLFKLKYDENGDVLLDGARQSGLDEADKAALEKIYQRKNELNPLGDSIDDIQVDEYGNEIDQNDIPLPTEGTQQFQRQPMDEDISDMQKEQDSYSNYGSGILDSFKQEQKPKSQSFGDSLSNLIPGTLPTAYAENYMYTLTDPKTGNIIGQSTSKKEINAMKAEQEKLLETKQWTVKDSKTEKTTVYDNKEDAFGKFGAVTPGFVDVDASVDKPFTIGYSLKDEKGKIIPGSEVTRSFDTESERNKFQDMVDTNKYSIKDDTSKMSVANPFLNPTMATTVNPAQPIIYPKHELGLGPVKLEGVKSTGSNKVIVKEGRSYLDTKNGFVLVPTGKEEYNFSGDSFITGFTEGIVNYGRLGSNIAAVPFGAKEITPHDTFFGLTGGGGLGAIIDPIFNSGVIEAPIEKKIEAIWDYFKATPVTAPNSADSTEKKFAITPGMISLKNLKNVNLRETETPNTPFLEQWTSKFAQGIVNTTVPALKSLGGRVEKSPGYYLGTVVADAAVLVTAGRLGNIANQLAVTAPIVAKVASVASLALGGGGGLTWNLKNILVGKSPVALNTPFLKQLAEKGIVQVPESGKIVLTKLEEKMLNRPSWMQTPQVKAAKALHDISGTDIGNTVIEHVDKANLPSQLFYEPGIVIDNAGKVSKEINTNDLKPNINKQIIDATIASKKSNIQARISKTIETIGLQEGVIDNKFLSLAKERAVFSIRNNEAPDNISNEILKRIKSKIDNTSLPNTVRERLENKMISLNVINDFIKPYNDNSILWYKSPVGEFDEGLGKLPERKFADAMKNFDNMDVYGEALPKGSTKAQISTNILGTPERGGSEKLSLYSFTPEPGTEYTGNIGGLLDNTPLNNNNIDNLFFINDIEIPQKTSRIESTFGDLPGSSGMFESKPLQETKERAIKINKRLEEINKKLQSNTELNELQKNQKISETERSRMLKPLNEEMNKLNELKSQGVKETGSGSIKNQIEQLQAEIDRTKALFNVNIGGGKFASLDDHIKSETERILKKSSKELKKLKNEKNNLEQTLKKEKYSSLPVNNMFGFDIPSVFGALPNNALGTPIRTAVVVTKKTLPKLGYDLESGDSFSRAYKTIQTAISQASKLKSSNLDKSGNRFINDASSKNSENYNVYNPQVETSEGFNKKISKGDENKNFEDSVSIKGPVPKEQTVYLYDELEKVRLRMLDATNSNSLKQQVDAIADSRNMLLKIRENTMFSKETKGLEDLYELKNKQVPPYKALKNKQVPPPYKALRSSIGNVITDLDSSIYSVGRVEQNLDDDSWKDILINKKYTKATSSLKHVSYRQEGSGFSILTEIVVTTPDFNLNKDMIDKRLYVQSLTKPNSSKKKFWTWSRKKSGDIKGLPKTITTQDFIAQIPDVGGPIKGSTKITKVNLLGENISDALRLGKIKLNEFGEPEAFSFNDSEAWIKAKSIENKSKMLNDDGTLMFGQDKLEQLQIAKYVLRGLTTGKEGEEVIKAVKEREWGKKGHKKTQKYIEISINAKVKKELGINKYGHMPVDDAHKLYDKLKNEISNLNALEEKAIAKARAEEISKLQSDFDSKLPGNTLFGANAVFKNEKQVINAYHDLNVLEDDWLLSGFYGGKSIGINDVIDRHKNSGTVISGINEENINSQLFSLKNRGLIQQDKVLSGVGSPKPDIGNVNNYYVDKSGEIEKVYKKVSLNGWEKIPSNTVKEAKYSLTPKGKELTSDIMEKYENISQPITSRGKPWRESLKNRVTTAKIEDVTHNIDSKYYDLANKIDTFNIQVFGGKGIGNVRQFFNSGSAGANFKQRLMDISNKSVQSTMGPNEAEAFQKASYALKNLKEAKTDLSRFKSGKLIGKEELERQILELNIENDKLMALKNNNKRTVTGYKRPSYNTSGERGVSDQKLVSEQIKSVKQKLKILYTRLKDVNDNVDNYSYGTIREAESNVSEAEKKYERALIRFGGGRSKDNIQTMVYSPATENYLMIDIERRGNEILSFSNDIEVKRNDIQNINNQLEENKTNRGIQDIAELPGIKDPSTFGTNIQNLERQIIQVKNNAKKDGIELEPYYKNVSIKLDNSEIDWNDNPDGMQTYMTVFNKQYKPVVGLIGNTSEKLAQAVKNQRERELVKEKSLKYAEEINSLQNTLITDNPLLVNVYKVENDLLVGSNVKELINIKLKELKSMLAAHDFKDTGQKLFQVENSGYIQENLLEKDKLTLIRRYLKKYKLSADTVLTDAKISEIIKAPKPSVQNQIRFKSISIKDLIKRNNVTPSRYTPLEEEKSNIELIGENISKQTDDNQIIDDERIDDVYDWDETGSLAELSEETTKYQKITDSYTDEDWYEEYISQTGKKYDITSSEDKKKLKILLGRRDPKSVGLAAAANPTKFEALGSLESGFSPLLPDALKLASNENERRKAWTYIILKRRENQLIDELERIDKTTKSKKSELQVLKINAKEIPILIEDVSNKKFVNKKLTPLDMNIQGVQMVSNDGALPKGMVKSEFVQVKRLNTSHEEKAFNVRTQLQKIQDNIIDDIQPKLIDLWMRTDNARNKIQSNLQSVIRNVYLSTEKSTFMESNAEYVIAKFGMSNPKYNHLTVDDIIDTIQRVEKDKDKKLPDIIIKSPPKHYQPKTTRLKDKGKNYGQDTVDNEAVSFTRAEVQKYRMVDNIIEELNTLWQSEQKAVIKAYESNLQKNKKLFPIQQSSVTGNKKPSATRVFRLWKNDEDKIITKRIFQTKFTIDTENDVVIADELTKIVNDLQSRVDKNSLSGKKRIRMHWSRREQLNNSLEKMRENISELKVASLATGRTRLEHKKAENNIESLTKSIIKDKMSRELRDIALGTTNQYSDAIVRFTTKEDALLAKKLQIEYEIALKQASLRGKRSFNELQKDKLTAMVNVRESGGKRMLRGEETITIPNALDLLNNPDFRQVFFGNKNLGDAPESVSDILKHSKRVTNIIPINTKFTPIEIEQNKFLLIGEEPYSKKQTFITKAIEEKRSRDSTIKKIQEAPVVGHVFEEPPDLSLKTKIVSKVFNLENPTSGKFWTKLSGGQEVPIGTHGMIESNIGKITVLDPRSSEGFKKMIEGTMNPEKLVKVLKAWSGDKKTIHKAFEETEVEPSILFNESTSKKIAIFKQSVKTMVNAEITKATPGPARNAVKALGSYVKHKNNIERLIVKKDKAESDLIRITRNITDESTRVPIAQQLKNILNDDGVEVFSGSYRYIKLNNGRISKVPIKSSDESENTLNKLRNSEFWSGIDDPPVIGKLDTLSVNSAKRIDFFKLGSINGDKIWASATSEQRQQILRRVPGKGKTDNGSTVYTPLNDNEIDILVKKQYKELPTSVRYYIEDSGYNPKQIDKILDAQKKIKETKLEIEKETELADMAFGSATVETISALSKDKLFANELDKTLGNLPKQKKGAVLPLEGYGKDILKFSEPEPEGLQLIPKFDSITGEQKPSSIDNSEWKKINNQPEQKPRTPLQTQILIGAEKIRKDIQAQSQKLENKLDKFDRMIDDKTNLKQIKKEWERKNDIVFTFNKKTLHQKEMERFKENRRKRKAQFITGSVLATSYLLSGNTPAPNDGFAYGQEQIQSTIQSSPVSPFNNGPQMIKPQPTPTFDLQSKELNKLNNFKNISPSRTDIKSQSDIVSGFKGITDVGLKMGLISLTGQKLKVIPELKITQTPITDITQITEQRQIQSLKINQESLLKQLTIQQQVFQEPLIPRESVPRFIKPNLPIVPFWLNAGPNKQKPQKPKPKKKAKIVWAVPDVWFGHYDPEEYRVVKGSGKVPKKFLTGNFGFDSE